MDLITRAWRCNYSKLNFRIILIHINPGTASLECSISDTRSLTPPCPTHHWDVRVWGVDMTGRSHYIGEITIQQSDRSHLLSVYSALSRIFVPSVECFYSLDTDFWLQSAKITISTFLTTLSSDLQIVNQTLQYSAITRTMMFTFRWRCRKVSVGARIK